MTEPNISYVIQLMALKYIFTFPCVHLFSFIFIFDRNIYSSHFEKYFAKLEGFIMLYFSFFYFILLTMNLIRNSFLYAWFHISSNETTQHEFCNVKLTTAITPFYAFYCRVTCRLISIGKKNNV